MEPRSWKWIQAAVVIVAAAVGLAVALWYQNRPVNDALPAPVAMPKRRTVLRPFHPAVIPSIAPVNPGAASALSAGTGPDAVTTAGAVPAPSQSAAYSSQNTVVDPMAHLQVPPVTGTVPAYSGVPVTPLPPTVTAAPAATPGSAPFTPLSGSPTAASPAPASSVSPLVTTAPSTAATPAAPSATPGL